VDVVVSPFCGNGAPFAAPFLVSVTVVVVVAFFSVDVVVSPFCGDNAPFAAPFFVTVGALFCERVVSDDNGTPFTPLLQVMRGDIFFGSMVTIIWMFSETIYHK